MRLTQEANVNKFGMNVLDFNGCALGTAVLQSDSRFPFYAFPDLSGRVRLAFDGSPELSQGDRVAVGLPLSPVSS